MAFQESPSFLQLRSRLFRREEACATQGHSLCPLKGHCCKEGLICVGSEADVTSCSSSALNCTKSGYEVSCDGGRTSHIGCCKNGSKCDFSGKLLNCIVDEKGKPTNVPPILAPSVVAVYASSTGISSASTAKAQTTEYKPSAVIFENSKSVPLATIIGATFGGVIFLYLLFEGWLFVISRRKGPVVMLLFAIASCCCGKRRHGRSFGDHGDNATDIIGGDGASRGLEGRAKSPEIPPPDFGPPVYNGLVDLGPVINRPVNYKL